MKTEKDGKGIRIRGPRVRDKSPAASAALVAPSGHKKQADRHAARGWRKVVADFVGPRLGAHLAGEAAVVADNARTLYHALLRELPSSSASVRAEVSSAATARAWAGFWQGVALEKIGTPESDVAQEKSAKLNERAASHMLKATAFARESAEASRKAAAPKWQSFTLPPVAADASDDDDDDDDSSIDLGADDLDDESAPLITKSAAPTTSTKSSEPEIPEHLDPAKAYAKQQAALDARHAQWKADRNRIGFDPRVVPPPIVAPPVGFAPTTSNFAAAQSHAQKMQPAAGLVNPGTSTMGAAPVSHWPPQSRALRVLSDVEQAEQDEEGARLRAEYARIQEAKK